MEIIPNWHPIFVHFTVALIPTSALCYLVGFHISHRKIGKELLLVARWCLWLGAIAAIATLSAGFIAYYTVDHDSISHLAMTEHRNWAIITFIMIICLTLWSVRAYFKKQPIRMTFILSMLLTASLLMTTAWFGAEVVYRYGIGVKSLPQLNEQGHDHSRHPDKITSTKSSHTNDKDENTPHSH